MPYGLLGGAPVLRGVQEELLEEVEASSVEGWGHLGGGEAGPLGEGRVPVLELGDAGPEGLGGGAALAEDLEELVDLTGGEKWGMEVRGVGGGL